MLNIKMKDMSLKAHYAFAFFLRVVLVAYANFHDKYFSVPYTDVDYKVFTDAARHVMDGNSPYKRHTYRYTPLLSFLLTPNIFLHKDFGKILFSAMDIAVAVLIQKILERRGCKDAAQRACVYLWLYNPLTVVISTRGNADSVAVFLVVLTLHSLLQDKLLLAGLLHGLSIHFRLYPIVFSLPMYLSLTRNANIVPNRGQLKLVCGCLLFVFVLTAVNCYLYGYEFLYESLIYHLTRKDTRHNFSVYFYMLYLSADTPAGIIQRAFMSLPQLTLLLTLSYFYSDKSRLAFAMFAQAMVMVAYNPVITSQYFFWFLSLLPLCLPDIRMSKTKAIALIASWFASQAVWLLAAYYLEFRGVNSFTLIWLAGLLFFAVNVKILSELVNCYTGTK